MSAPLAANSFLIVDDNPDDFFAVQRSLGQAGLGNPLHHCESGDEALTLLDAAAAAGTLPALVLLDVNMPGMKGGEVLAAIRSRPPMARLPVVMLTSSSDDRDVEAAFKGRASAYLNKPLDFDALIRAVQRIRTHRFEIVLRAV